jgi:hypothetical protein
MIALLSRADDILRRRPWTTESADARSALAWTLAVLVACGMIYGAVMGVFGGVSGERAWQVLYSAIKVPLLLLAAFSISLPSFFVINTLLGLRGDFLAALRSLVAAQAGLAAVLLSLAPFTLFWYASSADYDAALRFNGLVFAVASLAGQRLLRGYYAPLIQRNPKHRWMLWAWLVVYVFVAIQMAWILRPFVGAAGAPVEFLRQESWSNAYEVVARLIYEAVAR